MNLLPHQIKFAKDYKGPNLIVHEGGTGKTVCACVWLNDHEKVDSALVICPKRVVQKWKDTLKEWGADAVVFSKEEFKKIPTQMWPAIVVDEADEFASPLFQKGRSQLATALYETVKMNTDTPILLLTATPIRSTPWNLHSLLCYAGYYIDPKVWKKEFFELKFMPYLPRPAYFPVKDWRTKIRPYLERYADIVLLKDCVDELPPVTEETIEMKYAPVLSDGNFFDKHRVEQVGKHLEILKIAKDYRKVLVVAFYVEQIKELTKQLEKDREVFTVYGETPHQEEVLKYANESDECFLVVQASLGAGFDADTFSCVVFASMSYKVRDFVQMKYRVRRIHNLHPVKYYYLIGGKCDKAVKETIELGKDFIPSEWNNI